MIPAAFEYLKPTSVKEVIALLRAYGEDARLLAGGHSLIPLMKLRLASPRYLIDIGGIHGLAYISEHTDGICIGALTTHAEIEHSEVLKAHFPLLPEAAARIGDVQVRNRGTIGGSLAHAHPAADFPAVLLALDAEMLLQGPGGQRVVPAVDFSVSPFTTALRPDEVLVEIRIPPLPSEAGTAYLKAEDKASHFAIAGVAAVIDMDAAGRCRAARVAVTGVAAVPYPARSVEAALLNQRLDRPTIEAAAQHAVEGVQPLPDRFASGDYRAHLARVYTSRVIVQAAGRAGSDSRERA